MKREKKSIFYKVLLAILLVLLLVFCYIRFGLLRPWLTRFEAAQPKHTSQEIFQTLFSPADWGRVYDEANLDGTVYQGREGFIQSMEELTAGQELTLVETSAGLSGDRRYIVKAGSDSVAAFTLVNKGQDGETAWQLDSVEMLLGQTGTVTVRARTAKSSGFRRLLNTTCLRASQALAPQSGKPRSAPSVRPRSLCWMRPGPPSPSPTTRIRTASPPRSPRTNPARRSAPCFWARPRATPSL